MTRCYVTGVAGFLGSHLADYLLAQDHEVLGCDDLSTGELINVPRGVSFQQLNVEDLWPADLTGVEVVYHCAALAYEGVSNFSPALISRNVYAGSAAVFSAAIGAGVKRIVNCSSMARYGEPHRTARGVPVPFYEDQAPNPVDPYGIAKLASEALLKNLAGTHGLEYAVAVPHNIYGPRQRFIDPHRNVAAIFVNRYLQGKQPIIYGDGQQTRCFSYVDDVAPYLAILGFNYQAHGAVVNLGPDPSTGSSAITVLGLARTIAELLNVPCDPIFLPPRPREVKHAVCSSERVRTWFGFEEKTSLRQGLQVLIDYVRSVAPNGRPFDYRLNLEFTTPLTPQTWVERSM